jgi:hypothetical protein
VEIFKSRPCHSRKQLDISPVEAKLKKKIRQENPHFTGKQYEEVFVLSVATLACLHFAATAGTFFMVAPG